MSGFPRHVARVAVPRLAPFALGRISQRTVSQSRLHSTRKDTSAVLDQLHRVAELQERVRATNSNQEKQRIIADFPDLRSLLERVYHPNFRTHLSSATLETYLSSSSASTGATVPPTDILGLFDQLSARAVTGNAAKQLVGAFLAQNGIISTGDSDFKGDETALAVFKRLLDRNLVAGFGTRTLEEINWNQGGAEDNESSGMVSGSSEDQLSTRSHSTRAPSTMASSVEPSSTATKRFTCALGKTIHIDQVPTLFVPASPKWYASRKLDGVRVITFLDFLIPTDTAAQPLLINIQHLSRTGNAFTSLGNLAGQLSSIERFPNLREWLEGDLAVDGMEGGLGAVKRLVLDGEVCVMRPRSSEDDGIPIPPTDQSSHPLWTDDSNMIEDFPATVSEIRRGKHTIDHPRYYLFDLISWAEFSAGAAGSCGQVFSKRIEHLQEVGHWVYAEASKGAMEHGLRVLEQVAVGGVAEVEELVHTAAERGWEGLVLRADKPYRGTRSSDVRKFKQWQDAEYTVRDIEISRQRLSINGVYGEHDAVAALVIHHKGHPVSVGSGLSAEQRLNWAKDPSLIVGKQMTVEYFSESEAVGREGVMSLRFPRIKTVWEDGKRSI